MGPRRACSPLDAALGLFITQLFWVCMAYSQRSFTSFGPYAEFPTPYPPSTIAVVTQKGGAPPVIVGALTDRPGLNKFRLTPEGRIAFEGVISTGIVPGTLVPLDTDGDGTEEIVVLSAEGLHLEIVRTGPSTPPGQLIRLEHPARRVIAADINNDNRRDLLLFGRTMSGVASLTAQKGGRFAPGPVFFPEHSASDLVAADLNGDRITDVVMLEWLSNRFAVQFGVGRGVFSEQVVLELPDEPRRISYMPVQGRRTLRFLVTLPNRDAVAHIVGTPAGEFSLREIIPLPGRPLAVSFALINDDLLPDFVASTTDGITVALGSTATTFSAPSAFGTGAESVSWSLGDVDGDRRTDLVMADRRRSRIVVLGNARHSGSVAWPKEFAAGVQPGAVITGDCTGDGLPDLIVANAGSGSVGIFQMTSGGSVLGQRVVAVPEKPQGLKLVSGGHSGTATLITVHPSIQQLGITRLAGGEQTRQTTIPTEPRTTVLHAEFGEPNRRLRILVRSAQNGGSLPPLALYEEISGQRFLERSYRFTLPTAIAAMTIGDFSGGEKRDLVLALRDRTSGVTSVSLAPAREGYDFLRIQRLFVHPDSTAGVRYLFAGHLNADSTADLLLFYSRPRPALGYAFSVPGGSLLLDSVQTPGVNPGHEHALFLEDCDGDGDADIVYLDEDRDGVYWLRGSREGRFSRPEFLLKAEGARHLALWRRVPGESPGLILTHTARHTVSVHTGFFAP